MRWALHLCAAGVMILAIILAARERQPTLADPAASFTAFAQRAGLTPAGRGTLPSGDAALRFAGAACPAPMTFLLLNGLHRPIDRQLGWLVRQGRTFHVFYGGREVARPSGLSVSGPWMLRKAGEVLRLRRRSIWDQIVIAVAIPPGCDPPRLDWNGLELAQPTHSRSERRDAPGKSNP